ncbi:MAG: PD-(D/E)XK nuclease family protein [Veillonella parvula]|jgi:hypothetical protein|uniref:PD-(D/E)XK nuclease family protein n=1 Tax=Veillonella parvula TaxID=29466 RepID=UPI0025893FC6|nr:PD-(D/E)XK nuclease family protein [uncultured Veillonella sp.]
MNNIFTFATGELSQDAFICWCLNWINESDTVTTHRYRQLGLELLAKLIDNPSNSDVLSKVNIKLIDKVILVQQVLNIDVLAIIPQYKLAIIIEDKTFTSEHDNQISFYKDSLEVVFKCQKPWNAYTKLEKAFKLADLNIENADLANYHIHTVYFKTGYYFDYDWQVAHSESVHNYITGPMFWDILKNYDDCESDILRSYCEHIKNQLDWYQIVSNINGKYDDGCHYIKWERITQHGLLQIIFDNENIDGSWLWKDMSIYPNQYSTGTNQGGSPWTNRRFWTRSESDDIWATPPRNFNPWLFWRVDHDSKGVYLSLRYYNNDSTEQGKDLRKRIYKQLNTMIDKTIIEELDQLNIVYKNCITRPQHGNYYENTLIHIIIDSVLVSWDDNNGEPFIGLVRAIDKKLKEIIVSFDWKTFRL